MLSESARATSASEQRYRIDDPNSKPRKVKVVAMDVSAADLIDRLSRRRWSNATFHTALPAFGSAAMTGGGSLEPWTLDVIGDTKDLVDEIKATDLVVLVTRAGGQIEALIPLGESCTLHGVPVVALLIRDQPDFDEASREMVKTLRAIATMLVIVAAEDFVEEMLIALRA